MPKALPSFLEQNSSIRYCEDTCWLDYGFKKGDCKCDKHHGWYMWICWKRGGASLENKLFHSVGSGKRIKTAARLPVLNHFLRSMATSSTAMASQSLLRPLRHQR